MDGTAVESAFAFTFDKSNKTAVSGEDFFLYYRLVKIQIYVPCLALVLESGVTNMTLKRTISGMIGTGSLAHNRREFIAENVDSDRVQLNICYQNENLKEVYKELFDEAVERYNIGKRKDRQITNYYEKIRQGKQEKLFHEVIFQIGNREDMAVGTAEGDLAVKILDEYVKDFQKRNATLRVFGCYLHQDESTPHLHIDFIPYTVKPRLELAGADCERIIVIDESDKSLSMVDERLEQAIVRTGARLLILDPIQAYLGGGMDMNRANEARDMTKKLGALAEKTKCAIILIGHMNKASGNKAAYRGMGSIDFFAVARSVLLVGRVEGEPNTRAVVQIKNNLAAFGHPKAFALSEEGFQWIGDYEITVDEVLGGIAPKANKMELAKQMLRELAETHSAVLSNEIFDRADELGISKRTLENAKKELGIRARKINNAWYWELDKVKQE